MSDTHLEKERAIAAETAPLTNGAPSAAALARNGSGSHDGSAAGKPKGFVEDMGSSGLIQ